MSPLLYGIISMLIHLFFFTLGYLLGAKHQRQNSERKNARRNSQVEQAYVDEAKRHEFIQKSADTVNLPCNSQEDFYTNLGIRLSTKGYNVVQFTAYHYRVNDCLDIYPVNRRWHDLATGERGTYQDIFKFVRDFFSK